jgi:hypothetical protein
MAGHRDGFNGLTKNTPTALSVSDAYDIGFGAGQEDRRRGQGRPTDIPPESRPEPEAASFNARLPMHMKKVLTARFSYAVGLGGRMGSAIIASSASTILPRALRRASSV